MLNSVIRLLTALCLVVLAVGCETNEERAKAPRVEKRPMIEGPQRFDRVRAEQFEREEDRLSQRVRRY